MGRSVETEKSDMRLVIAGHGSRSQSGFEEFEEFMRLFRETYPHINFRHGYLEFNQPSVEEAVASILQEPGGPIIVVPGMHAAATHVKNDLPHLLGQLRQRFSSEDIRFGSVLDLHPNLLELCARRIAEAEAKSPNLVSRADTCLVLVGRGTSDPDANSDVAKLARILQEGMGFSASFVAFAGTTSPLVALGLKQASMLGFKRMIVLPYLLFNGVLAQRVWAAADALQKRSGSSIEILKCKHLGPDRQLAGVFMQRALEALNGTAAMNCSLCKYRVPLLGFEHDLGKPQIPHRAVPKPGIYKMHRIEEESFDIIRRSFDWSSFSPDSLPLLMRLVHTTGDFASIDDLFMSAGAVRIGVDALLRCKRIVTDVSMVKAGLRRQILADLNIETHCFVHDEESRELAEHHGITRSAAGVRRAWMRFGNELVLAIGDAPTAVQETVNLIRQHNWRPQLVVGLPVGFVGTRESKNDLKSCLQVPRITNSGTRGGSNWAASVMNTLLIEALNKVAGNE